MKWNKKLENKFFRLFRILHGVGKQVYKLELSTRWKIYDIFHVLLLEQDITKKGQVNNDILPESEKKFEAGDKKKYKVKAIINNVVYNKEGNNQTPGFYYLIL